MLSPRHSTSPARVRSAASGGFLGSAASGGFLADLLTDPPHPHPPMLLAHTLPRGPRFAHPPSFPALAPGLFAATGARPTLAACCTRATRCPRQWRAGGCSRSGVHPADRCRRRPLVATEASERFAAASERPIDTAQRRERYPRGLSGVVGRAQHELRARSG
eukprot:7388520-Prymnesium_polylepis.1